MESTAATSNRKLVSSLIRWGVGPAAIYLVAFVLVTYPLMRDFSTHFFSDGRDGLRMIWNIWWINKAVTQLHQSPWYTDYLFYPYGISLLTHTLCPFAGFLGIALLPFLTLTQTYNTIVVFSFVSAGLTTFWLSFHVVKSYWPSLVAGFIFSFSNYHFAHMRGHLNLASLEWIPLFVLCWYVLLRRPSPLIALAAALSLFAVILCDYYYFSYCFLIALLMFLWRMIQGESRLFFLKRPYVVAFSTFVAAAVGSSGILIYKLLGAMNSATFLGAHDPSKFPADLLAPFAYGACLRFSHLTSGLWGRFQGNTSESSVYVGVTVVGLIVYAWIRRKEIKAADLHFWCVALLLFFVLSLGPKLYVAGKQIPFALMPYRALELLLPPLKFGGMPSRMMVMVMLCAAVIGAMGLDLLLRGSRKTRIGAGVLIAILFVEFLPFRVEPFRQETPRWVWVLRDLPNAGGVIDTSIYPYRTMYFQILHEKPIQGGLAARVPTDLDQKDMVIRRLVAARNFEKLRDEYGFRYVVSRAGHIYDLAEGRVIHREK